jgi:hypothetical protein
MQGGSIHPKPGGSITRNRAVTTSRRFIRRFVTSTGALRTGRWRNTNACGGIDGEPSIGYARLSRAIQRSLLTGRCCIGHRLGGKSRMSGDVQVRIRERLGVRFPRATRPVVLCRSREEAESALARMRAWVNANGLMLHSHKTHVGDCRIEGQGFEYPWIPV